MNCHLQVLCVREVKVAAQFPILHSNIFVKLVLLCSQVLSLRVSKFKGKMDLEIKAYSKFSRDAITKKQTFYIQCICSILKLSNKKSGFLNGFQGYGKSINAQSSFEIRPHQIFKGKQASGQIKHGASGNFSIM